jgi:molybdenum cofactor cytidylyltransferase
MTAIIILAAGSSSRLGKPKQNLVYKGQTLLQRAIETARASVCSPVMLVLGANYELIRQGMKNLPIRTIYNQDWEEGMASSIRLGTKTMQKLYPKISSIILMLCDQPFADAPLLDELVKKKSLNGIIASGYNDTAGPPVLFDKKYFDDLLLLKGHEGAKKLLLQHPEDVFIIQFPLAGIDIDTMEDFERL